MELEKMATFILNWTLSAAATQKKKKFDTTFLLKHSYLSEDQYFRRCMLF